MTLVQRAAIMALKVGDIEVLPIENQNTSVIRNRLRSTLNMGPPFWCWSWSVKALPDSVVVKKVRLKPLACPWTCKLHNHPSSALPSVNPKQKGAANK